MDTHADKSQETKNQSNVTGKPRVARSDGTTFYSADNRSVSTAQRELKNRICDSSQAKQLSAFQEMANSSPQADRTAQFQLMAGSHSAQQQHPVQAKKNNTGLPDDLKSGIENLSGYSMDDVKVHYNSDKPTQLNAHAYAQGSDIHIASGQEKHLPHEAWHVVQQKQGRVKPTMQMKGTLNINDDVSLEKEADEMGARALSQHAFSSAGSPAQQTVPSGKSDIQLKITKDKLNVVGENHDESELPGRRDQERKIATDDAGGEYWNEYQFNTKGWFPSFGDDPDLRARHHLATLRDFVAFFLRDYSTYTANKSKMQKDHDGMYFTVTASIDRVELINVEARRSTDPKVEDALPHSRKIGEYMGAINGAKKPDTAMVVPDAYLIKLEALRADIIKQIGNKSTDEISLERSKNMAKRASGRKGKKMRGIWKVGESHVQDILADSNIPQSEYELTSRSAFNRDYPELPLLPK